jgi:hypothetical protein
LSRLSASLRMSTRSELLSGVTILSASLLMRAVSMVSPIGFFRDSLGVFSVLFLVAGIGVLAVGLVHRAMRTGDDEPHVDEPGQMANETMLATGAVIGVGIGCSVGAVYGGALPVALGTAIGAAAGVALASQRLQRRQRSR